MIFIMPQLQRSNFHFNLSNKFGRKAFETFRFIEHRTKSHAKWRNHLINRLTSWSPGGESSPRSPPGAPLVDLLRSISPLPILTTPSSSSLSSPLISVFLSHFLSLPDEEKSFLLENLQKIQIFSCCMKTFNHFILFT